MARPKGSRNKELQLSPNAELSPDFVQDVKRRAKNKPPRKKRTDAQQVGKALVQIRKMIGKQRERVNNKPVEPTKTSQEVGDSNVGYTFAEPLNTKPKSAKQLAQIALAKQPWRNRVRETTATYAAALLNRRMKGRK